MILWLVLFLLIVVISFILAFQSMKDYQEIPQKAEAEYGLFLIRQIDNFNAGTLDSIRRLMLAGDLIISIERLFKGNEAALTIFGPKKMLENLTNELNLLELEDYTFGLGAEDVSVWEVGVKSNKNLNMDNLGSIFDDLPTLGEGDQFFWQVLLKVQLGGKDLSFQTQIRAVIYSSDPTRRKALMPQLQNIGLGELTKIPRPFSTEQNLSLYRFRSLAKDSKGPILTSEGVMRLLKI